MADSTDIAVLAQLLNEQARAPRPYLWIHADGKAHRRPALPLKVRIRLRAARYIDALCCRLCDRGFDDTAILIWRACRMWRA